MQRQTSSPFSVMTVVGITLVGSCFANTTMAQTSRRGNMAPVQGAPASEIQFGGDALQQRIDEFRLNNQAKNSGAKLTSRRQADITPQESEPVRPAPPANGPVKGIQVPGNDAEITQAEQAETTTSAEVTGEDVTGEDVTGEDVAEKEGSPLAPIQTRKLSNKITAVTTSQAGIGTGLLPETDVVSSGLVGLPTGFDRGVPFTSVHWQPSLVCHRPLYFEEAMLERNGHRHFGCLQPLASGAKFFTTIPLFPYLHTLRPPRSCVYDYGYYRPGTCAPLLHDKLPYDKHAAVAETLALAGFFWATPL